MIAVRAGRPGVPGQPPGSELVEAVRQSADAVVVKHTVGAFHGTALHQELQRRGVTTLAMAGIATNMGVESTARAAADLDHRLVFAEDAMSALTAAEHDASVRMDFPRFGSVVRSADIGFARL